MKYNVNKEGEGVNEENMNDTRDKQDRKEESNGHNLENMANGNRDM